MCNLLHLRDHHDFRVRNPFHSIRNLFLREANVRMDLMPFAQTYVSLYIWAHINPKCVAPHRSMLQVEAPIDLKQGYPLELEVDGKTVVISCPKDVQCGEVFEVDLETHILRRTMTMANSVEEASSKKDGAPSTADGKSFKYPLCTCCDSQVVCTAMWWFSWICSCIPTAQLLNRLKLNAIGRPRTSEDGAPTFWIVVGTYTLCRVIVFFFPVMRLGAFVFFWLLFFGYTVYWIVLLTRARLQFRNRYAIVGSTCNDCCISSFCTCCTLVQMFRQTQDETVHEYECCTLNGLPSSHPPQPRAMPESPSALYMTAATPKYSASVTDQNKIDRHRIDL